MSRSAAFWILMILWLIFGAWWYWPASTAAGPGYAVYGGLGVPLMIFALFVLLGWQVFGPPIKG